MKLELPSQINFERALKYMGSDSASEKTIGLLFECQKKILETAAPRLAMLELETIPSFILCGEDIKKHLQDCYGIIIYAITLGTEIDKLIRIASFRDITRQIVTDALSSVLTEEISEKFELQLKAEKLIKKIHITTSYAPGYGDYPLTILPEYLKAVDAFKKIGLSITENNIMIPRKSICVCLGMSHKPVTGFRAGCEHCKSAGNCKLFKEGKSCVR